MTWVLFGLLVASSIFMFRTPCGLRLRSVGEHPRAADTVGIDVYKVRYLSVITSSTIVAMGGAYLSIGYTHSFTENMTNGRGFIGLAALIAGSWRPGGAFCFALLFGFFGGAGRPHPGLRLRAAGVRAGAALPRHADRRRRSGRQVDPARIGWTAVRQAVAPPRAATRARGGRSPAGSLSLAAIPAGTLLARESQRVTLVDSSGSVVIAALLGWAAIVLARRAQDRLQITLGRAGGGGSSPRGQDPRDRRPPRRRDGRARARVLGAPVPLCAVAARAYCAQLCAASRRHRLQSPAPPMGRVRDR